MRAAPFDQEAAEWSAVSTSLPQAALDLAFEGWRVFPLKPGEKKPLGGHGFKDATADPEKVGERWRLAPNANIGIATGEGLFVVDIDGPAGEEWLADQAVFNGALPRTVEQRTGKGRHLFFTAPEEVLVPNSVSKIALGVDIRGDGGYVVAAPSLHPTGGRYEWAPGRSPFECKVALAPQWLLDLVEDDRPIMDGDIPTPAAAAAPATTSTDWGRAALEGECEKIRQAPEGEQEATLSLAALKIGGKVAGGELNHAEAREALITAGLAMPNYRPGEPWDRYQITSKIDSGLARGALQPRNSSGAVGGEQPDISELVNGLNGPLSPLEPLHPDLEPVPASGRLAVKRVEGLPIEIERLQVDAFAEGQKCLAKRLGWAADHVLRAEGADTDKRLGWAADELRLALDEFRPKGKEGEKLRGRVEAMLSKIERTRGALPPFVDLSDKLIFAGEIEPVLDQPALVKGLLSVGSSAMVVGPSNAGKTLFATDLAMRVALGWNWSDRKVEPGPVLYLPLEGGAGIRQRIAAFKQARLAPPFVPFAISDAPINFMEPSAVDAVCALAEGVERKYHTKPVLIVIDTVSRALFGEDENSPAGMGKFVATIDAIRARTGATVLGIHHSGKDETKGARGHSLLTAAMDTVIGIVPGPPSPAGLPTGIATVTKQRDFEKSGVWTFDIETVELGRDADGDPVTSAVITVHEGRPRAAHVSEVDQEFSLLGSASQDAYSALRRVIRNKGREMPEGDDLPSDRLGVSEDEWRAAMYAERGNDTQASKRQAFTRARKDLKKKGFIDGRGSWVWAVKEEIANTAAFAAGEAQQAGPSDDADQLPVMEVAHNDGDAPATEVAADRPTTQVAARESAPGEALSSAADHSSVEAPVAAPRPKKPRNSQQRGAKRKPSSAPAKGRRDKRDRA